MIGIKVAPGEPASIIALQKGLKSMQELVNGYIEIIYPFDDDVCIVCNEEGKILNLPANRPLIDENGDIYDIIHGTFLVLGVTDDDFIDLTQEQVQHYIDYFNTTCSLNSAAQKG